MLNSLVTGCPAWRPVAREDDMRRWTRTLLALFLLPTLLAGCIIDPYWGEGHHHYRHGGYERR